MKTLVLPALLAVALVLTGCGSSSGKVSAPAVTRAQLEAFTSGANRFQGGPAAAYTDQPGTCFLLTTKELLGLPHPSGDWRVNGVNQVTNSVARTQFDSCNWQVTVGDSGPKDGAMVLLQDGPIHNDLPKERVVPLGGTGWNFAYLKWPGVSPSAKETEAVLNDVIGNVKVPIGTSEPAGHPHLRTLFLNDHVSGADPGLPCRGSAAKCDP